MHHKLQSSCLKNDGKNSVVRKPQAKTNRQNAQDFKARARSGGSERRNSKRSSSDSSIRNSRTRQQTARSERPAVVRDKQALRGKRPHDGERPSLVSEQTAAPRERTTPHATTLRCEVPHSTGFDPTGELAFPCGARAEVICETCGPMCAACAAETFCQSGEHKLASLPESEPQQARPEAKRPVTSVVYVELRCPNRCRVRVALPTTHRVQAKRKCPVCKAMASTKYLAHGFTRRQLPFHEVWTDDDEFIFVKGGEPSDDPDFKRRVPWDGREKKWQQNRRR